MVENINPTYFFTNIDLSTNLTDKNTDLEPC